MEDKTVQRWSAVDVGKKPPEVRGGSPGRREGVERSTRIYKGTQRSSTKLKDKNRAVGEKHNQGTRVRTGGRRFSINKQ